MTDQHRATPEQWTHVAICLLELRARVEALEAAQLEQAESHRFCTDAIVRRVEWLEATQHAHADLSRLSDAEREQVAQELAKPAAWRPLETETTYGTEAFTATAQQILRAPMVVEGTFDHGGETYRFKAKPERETAMDKLRAASAEARPAGGLVERVETRAGGDGRAAIREVAAWLRENDSECQMGGDAAATAELLEQEADRG